MSTYCYGQDCQLRERCKRYTEFFCDNEKWLGKNKQFTLVDYVDCISKGYTNLQDSESEDIEVRVKFLGSDQIETFQAKIGTWDQLSNDDDVFYWFDIEPIVGKEYPDFVLISYERV